MATRCNTETTTDVDDEMTEGDFEPPSPRESRAIEKRNIRHLYFNTGWQGILTSVIATFIPVFAVRVGASTFEISLLTAIPALVMITLSIPAASFIARQQRLLRFVSLTLAGSWFCSIAIPFLPSFMTGRLNDYVPEGIILITGVAAAFTAFSSPAWTSVLAESISPRLRPVVNGQRWAVLSVVSAATVFCAGWYLDSVRFLFGYQSLLVATGIAGVISLFYLERLETLTTRTQSAQTVPSFWQTVSGIPDIFRRQPAFAQFTVSSFVYRMGLGLPAALFPIFWVDDLKASDAWIGYRATAAQIALVVSYALWGRIAGRKGYRFVLVSCGIGSAFYPFLTSITPSPIWLIPVAIVWGLFAGGIDVSLFEGLIDTIPVDERVLYAAINLTFTYLTVLLGPLIGIVSVSVIGIRATIGLAGVACLTGALLFRILGARTASSPNLELAISERETR